MMHHTARTMATSRVRDGLRPQSKRNLSAHPERGAHVSRSGTSAQVSERFTPTRSSWLNQVEPENWLLRVRRERPRDSRAAEKPNEIAPFQSIPRFEDCTASYPRWRIAVRGLWPTSKGAGRPIEWSDHGRYCCKSLFALVIKNSPGRRRDFLLGSGSNAELLETRLFGRSYSDKPKSNDQSGGSQTNGRYPHQSAPPSILHFRGSMLRCHFLLRTNICTAARLVRIKKREKAASRTPRRLPALLRREQPKEALRKDSCPRSRLQSHGHVVAL
jgi:hypothetical protein